jgi:NADPH:quinone reductase-like Zn-dependent oxidoreductase
MLERIQHSRRYQLGVHALPCAVLTVWSALMSLHGRSLRRGIHVLKLESGEISLFILQIATAAAATVIGTISTTLSVAKADRLISLGARQIIEYKDDPDLGQMALQMFPQGAGFDLVIEVSGESTVKRFAIATKLEGILAFVDVVNGV